jgi:hypothetical protein
VILIAENKHAVMQFIFKCINIGTLGAALNYLYLFSPLQHYVLSFIFIFQLIFSLPLSHSLDLSLADESGVAP